MIRIGTCGFSRYSPGGNWRMHYGSLLQAYTHAFDTGELNRTFYQLPRVETAERWHREAAPGFEFTLKAWQALTHPAGSPTWRNCSRNLTEKQRQGFGWFRPNREVMDAWKETRRVAEALRARVCVLQTPASFSSASDNEKNLRRFFSQIDRGNLELAWEPRGDWNDKPDLVRNLCVELELTHVVDPMRRSPVSETRVSYFRLHGLNPREYDYNPSSGDNVLRELAARLRAFENNRERVYCMFNNFQMYKNAKRLREMLG
jgi:uncharacterized protein YecE (DUF72 family)